MISKIFRGNIKSLEDTLEIIDRQSVSEFSKLCATATRIIFIGQGSSGFVGEEAALRFAHLDIQAESYCDTVEVLLHASRMKKGQICVGISHSGRTTLVSEGLKLAKENGAATALITNYMNTPIKEHCDNVFHTSFVENSVKSAAVSSKIAQLAILDTIYLLTAKKKRGLWNLSELDTALERVLRDKQLD